MKVVIDVQGSGAPQEVVHPVPPRNVQLTSEYLAHKKRASSQEEEQHESPGSANKKQKVQSWLLQDADPEHVREEKRWTKYLADNDKLSKEFWLRSRLGVCLESLVDGLPTYTEKDLAVVHRQNSAGAWKCEVWTKRDFLPKELAFAPVSSLLKVSHLTLAANQPVGVPLHGAGAHPGGTPLALDGRARASIAAQDLVDSQEHKGSLFWIVERTSDSSQANMCLEPVTWEHRVTLNMPFKKKKKHTVEWESKDLPSVPLLINKKEIKAHQRLSTMHLPPAKKDES